MSDNWITFVSAEPDWIPSEEIAGQLEDIARSEFPEAEEVNLEFHDTIVFVDPGSNFEAVSCPNCKADLMEWWQDEMEAKSEIEFSRLDCTVPCCGSSTTLNELTYDWPAAFGRFQLDVMNPNVPDAAAAVVEALETIASTHFRVVRIHI